MSMDSSVAGMRCLGVHFALTAEEVARLRAIEDGPARIEYLQEEIEERYFEEPMEFAAESDRAWDAMHRALAGGSLTWDGGSYPLNHTVLGGESLHEGGDYIMSLKTPEQVKAVAAGLVHMTIEEFRRRYEAIDARDYVAGLSEEDFGYTWEWFVGVRDLFCLAAEKGRYILFTADQ